jgi:ArsR family transcriptional regulator
MNESMRAWPTLRHVVRVSCFDKLTSVRQVRSHQCVLTYQDSLMHEAALRALGDPLRLRIVTLLAGEQLCTCHLVDETGATQTNISNHLRVLREAGVIESAPAGRYTYHRLVPERLEELAGALGDLARGARRAVAIRRPCG